MEGSVPLKQYHLLQKKYQALFNNAHYAKFVIDTRLHILEANFRALEVFGSHPLGQYLPQFLNIKNTQEFSRLLHNHLKSTSSEWVTFDLHHKDGRVRTIEWNAAINFTSGVHMVAIHDITPYLVEMHRREMLVNILGHELKTPVTVIKSYAQLLHRRLSSSVDEKSLTQLKKIDTTANSLKQLIDNIVDEMRLNLDQLDFKDELVDLNLLVKEAATNMNQSTQSNRITFLSPGKKVEVYVDPERIKQVLFFLFDNAIKYSAEVESVKVTLSLEDPQAHITISDSGHGISSKDLPHVFDAFYRIQANNEKRSGGMGLGLYLSREIIEHYRGKIWLNSTPQRGSTFHFTLPLHLAE